MIYHPTDAVVSTHVGCGREVEIKPGTGRAETPCDAFVWARTWIAIAGVDKMAASAEAMSCRGGLRGLGDISEVMFSFSHAHAHTHTHTQASLPIQEHTHTHSSILRATEAKVIPLIYELTHMTTFA